MRWRIAAVCKADIQARSRRTLDGTVPVSLVGSQPWHGTAQELPLANRGHLCGHSYWADDVLAGYRGKEPRDNPSLAAQDILYSECRSELLGRCHCPKAWTMPVLRFAKFVSATSRQPNLVRGFAMRHRAGQFSPRTFHDSPLVETSSDKI